MGPDNHVELEEYYDRGGTLGKPSRWSRGITASDRVIINPSDSLTSGAVVRIAEASAPRRPRNESWLRGVHSYLGLDALTGCAVGPHYTRPAAPVPPAYAGETNGWKVAEPQAHLPKGNWWEIFGNADLNQLEADALAANQN